MIQNRYNTVDQNLEKKLRSGIVIVHTPVGVHIGAIGEVIKIPFRSPGIDAEAYRREWRDGFLLFHVSTIQKIPVS